MCVMCVFCVCSECVLSAFCACSVRVWCFIVCVVCEVCGVVWSVCAVCVECCAVCALRWVVSARPSRRPARDASESLFMYPDTVAGAAAPTRR